MEGVQTKTVSAPYGADLHARHLCDLPQAIAVEVHKPDRPSLLRRSHLEGPAEDLSVHRRDGDFVDVWRGDSIDRQSKGGGTCSAAMPLPAGVLRTTTISKPLPPSPPLSSIDPRNRGSGGVGTDLHPVRARSLSSDEQSSAVIPVKLWSNRLDSLTKDMKQASFFR